MKDRFQKCYQTGKMWKIPGKLFLKHFIPIWYSFLSIRERQQINHYLKPIL